MTISCIAALSDRVDAESSAGPGSSLGPERPYRAAKGAGYPCWTGPRPATRLPGLRRRHSRCSQLVDQRLEADQDGADQADGDGLGDGPLAPEAGEPRADEAVGGDQADAAPLRHVDGGVDRHHPEDREEEEHARGGDAEGDRGDGVELLGDGVPGDPPARAQLLADELAVELGQAHGEGRAEHGRERHPGGGRVALEDDDHRQADDRSIDDARDLPAAQVLGDHWSDSVPRERRASASMASARWTWAML